MGAEEPRFQPGLLPPDAARRRPVKGRMRTPDTPGNMAALMTLSQVTAPDSWRKVWNGVIGRASVAATVFDRLENLVRRVRGSETIDVH